MPFSPKPRTRSSTRPCGLARSTRIALGGLDLIPDLAGALYVPDFRTLIAADLHFEKASSLARRGVHLPPYDTRETFRQLAAVVEAARPERLILLGDSFHDGEAAQRLHPSDLVRLAALVDAVDTIWIAGNHDPLPPAGLGGRSAREVVLGPLTLRHEPGALAEGECEIAGHLHPAASLSQRGRRVVAKCFAGDRRRMVMPAFGSFTGGLNVRAQPFAPVFPSGQFDVWMLGARALHKFPSSRLG